MIVAGILKDPKPRYSATSVTPFQPLIKNQISSKSLWSRRSRKRKPYNWKIFWYDTLDRIHYFVLEKQPEGLLKPGLRNVLWFL